MMDRLIDLEVIWDVIEATESGSPGLRVRATGMSVAAGDILLASDNDQRRHLLLPLTGDSAFAPDTSTRGVHITRRRLDTGEGIREFVDVECRRSHLNSVFVTLAEDIIDAAIGTPDQPATACRRVLDRWREFLESEPSPVLSEERLIGLIAELLILREVLQHDPNRRLDVWTGPTGAVHDFRRGVNAVDVKGTGLREGKFVEIHGVEQLAPPPGGTLHIAWVRLERDESSPVSVPALVREMRALGVDSLALTERLTCVGYDASHSTEYEQRRYRVVESRLYLVNEEFPRIISGSFSAGTVPVGVLRLSYTVDLTNEPPSQLDEDARTAALRRLGSG